MIDVKRGGDMIETRGRVESLRRNALAVIHRAMNHAESTGRLRRTYAKAKNAGRADAVVAGRR